MSRVITFSQQFPSYHLRSGQPTGFVSSILHNRGFLINDDYLSLLYDLNKNDLLFDNKLSYKNDILPLYESLKEKEEERFYDKKHTIRSGNRWHVGDKFSPRVWSGKPNHSPKIIFAPDIEVKKVWDFKIRTSRNESYFLLNDLKIKPYNYQEEIILLGDIAANDGLDYVDFLDWFKYPNEFSGQIICFDENVYY